MDMEWSCQLVVASVSSGVYHNYCFSFLFLFSFYFLSFFPFLPSLLAYFFSHSAYWESPAVYLRNRAGVSPGAVVCVVGCVAGEVTENVPTERNMSCWFGRRASALQNGWRVNIVSGHPCPEEFPTALAEWVMYDIVLYVGVGRGCWRIHPLLVLACSKVSLFVLNDIIICPYRYRTMQCRSDSGGQEESFNLWIRVGEFAGVVVASYQYRVGWRAWCECGAVS